MSVAEIASDVKVKNAARKLTKQQKAAAVIVSLGMDKASQLYKYMTPQDVERLTMEIAKLGYIDPDQTEGILDEYYQMCLTNKAVTEGGMEYARAVLERAFGQQTADSLLEKVTKSSRTGSFPSWIMWMQSRFWRLCNMSGPRPSPWFSPMWSRIRRRPSFRISIPRSA